MGPRWLRGKESAWNAGAPRDVGSNPGSGRSSGEGHSNPLQYSCLRNAMDRGAWWAAVHRAGKRLIWLKQLSTRMYNWFTSLYTWDTALQAIKHTSTRMYNWFTSLYTWDIALQINYAPAKIRKEAVSQDFPEGLVAKSLHSQFRGPGFNPWWEN